jgi:hypothetical protein
VTTTRPRKPAARPPAAPPPPPAAAEPAVKDANGLPPLARILGAVIAPTTALTALLYYFGWSHAYWFCNYFGVNSTTLGFTSTDYLMRSADALFVPMTVAAVGALVAIWGHLLLRAHLAAGARPRGFRFLVPGMAAAGAVLTLGGFVSVFTTTVLSHHLVAAPLSLGFGVLLLVYAVHVRRLLAGEDAAALGARGWAAVAEWATVFVLVGLSLFWAATDYSAAVGRSRAVDFVAGLPSYPDAVIYSDRSLSLHAPGVREVRCQDPAAAYRFRYSGLKLVLESGSEYLFLPAAWTPASGMAILLPQASSLRLEFFAPAARSAEPSTC